MIDLKTYPEALDGLALMTEDKNDAETIYKAAHDHQKLREYAEELERSVNQLSGEVNSIRTQRDAAADALLAIIRPELETMVSKFVNEHIEALEADIDDLKTQCEDIPNDDQITDSIREWFQYEAKFSITLD